MPNWPTPELHACSVSDALREAAARIGEHSPTARLDAEVLLAHVLDKSRTYLRAWPEALLDTDQLRIYADLIHRRQGGMPVAYLTGSREFWSREFIVSPDVLIPRPETELLIECALAWLADRPAATVLDLATGSGVIAVTLAAECPNARVYASDLSPAALAVARRNAARHQSRVGFFEGDWFAGLPSHLRFDLIVSNPPYVADSDPHLRDGDVRFEPRLALVAGSDGLDAYRIIAAQAPAALNPDGVLMLEHGYDQAEGIREVLRQCRYRAIVHYTDLQGHLRVTSVRAPLT